MKTLLTLLLCVGALCVSAQVETYGIRELKSTTHKLTGWVRGLGNDGDITDIKLNIPSDAVAININFLTSQGQNGMQILNKAIESGISTASKGLLNLKVDIPSGADAVEYYVFDELNYQNYKNGNSTRSFAHLTNVAKESITIPFNPLNTPVIYFCVKNSNNSSGTNISYTINAIVKQYDLSVWSKEKKAEIYNKYYTALTSGGLNKEMANEITSCLMIKITSLKTFEEMSAMAPYEVTSFTTPLAEACALSIVPTVSAEEEKAKAVASDGWKAYQNNNINEAIELTKQALGLAPNLTFAHLNLGLFYMIAYNDTESNKEYAKAIESNKLEKMGQKENMEAGIKDIKDAQIKYPYLSANSFVIYKLLLDEKYKY